MPSERREPKGRRDSGVVAVETGLVSMFLITLLFGVVDASFFFKDWLTVSSAARAGARMGASQPRIPEFAQDSADQVSNAITGLDSLSKASIEVWVFDANATTGLPSVSGVLPSGTNCSSSCMKYTWPGGATKLTYLSGTWPSTSQNACNGNAGRDTLGVYVKYPHTSPAGFFFKNATMSESTMMFLEPIPSSSVCM